MTEISSPPPELVRLVRSALVHLYDYAYLQNNPLAALIDRDDNSDRVASAQKLRRLLVDCIEALKPQGDDAPASRAPHAHPILSYRYIDGLAMTEIARKRALSLRQTYREHEVGVEAVAGLLRERLRVEAGSDLLASPPSPGTQWLEVQAEVARLRQAVHTESLPLGDLLGGVLALLAPLSQRTGSQISIATAGPWPDVVADRVMLRQALVSLLTHALGVAAPGAFVIRLSRERDDLCLDLQGTPASPEASERPPAASSSVGIAAAKSLLEAQGGRLELLAPQRPWHVRILLPTVAHATILAIDDNADLVALVQRYVGSYDIKVVGATDSAQAGRLAQELLPQLITLDVMMPGQDGWEILQTLKSTPEVEHIPVVVCSVLNEAQLAEVMGASDYLTKPITQADLLAVLKRWLGFLGPAA